MRPGKKTTVDAAAAPPWIEETLSRRFSLTDRKHPAVARLYAIAAKSLAAGPRPPAPKPAARPEAAGRETPSPKLLADIKQGVGVGDLNPPPLPGVFMELQQVVNDPQSTTEDIARVIGRDPGLVTSVLRIANSGFYSFLSRVDTVSRAVALIGSREIGMLVLGAAVLNLFKDAPKTRRFDRDRFWKHSVACALLASLIAGQAGRIDLERCFVAGLLHDIGRMLLVLAAPDLADEALRAAEGRAEPFHQVEREVLGFDHAELAGTLAKQWRFPPLLRAAIRNHHAPEQCEEPETPGVIHLADIMAKSLGCSLEPDPIVPPLSETAWNELELTPKDLDAIVEKFEEKAPDLFSVFAGASPSGNRPT